MVKTISCWVLIKRSLAGKLALCSQILNWMSLFPEKPPKFDNFEKTPNFRGFSLLIEIGISNSKSDCTVPTYQSKSSGLMAHILGTFDNFTIKLQSKGP